MTTAIDLMGRRPKPARGQAATLADWERGLKDLYSLDDKDGKRHVLKRPYDIRQWNAAELLEHIEMLNKNEVADARELEQLRRQLKGARTRLRNLTKVKR